MMMVRKHPNAEKIEREEKFAELSMRTIISELLDDDAQESKRGEDRTRIRTRGTMRTTNK